MTKNKKLREYATIDILKEIAINYGTNETPDERSKRLGVDRRKIIQWSYGLRGAGIDVARIKKYGLYLKVAHELAKTHPELIKKEVRKNMR
jgi:hypothetical protein